MPDPFSIGATYSNQQVIDMLTATEGQDTGLVSTSWPGLPKPPEKKKKASHKAAVDLAKKDAQIASLETSVRQKDYVVATLLGVVEACLLDRERDDKAESIVKVRDAAIENYAKSLEEDVKGEKNKNAATGSPNGY